MWDLLHDMISAIIRDGEDRAFDKVRDRVILKMVFGVGLSLE